MTGWHEGLQGLGGGQSTTASAPAGPWSYFCEGDLLSLRAGDHRQHTSGTHNRSIRVTYCKNDHDENEDPKESVPMGTLSNDEVLTPTKSSISTTTHDELVARQKLLATPGGKTYRQPHADVLHKIVNLWSELSVPLQHRSRFYGGINGGLRNSKKYCLLELTRLNWLRAQQASKSEVLPPI